MNQQALALNVNAALVQEETLGYAEAAVLLGVARGTLYAWTSLRKVPHYRIGRRCVRFMRSELVAWMHRHAVPIATTANGESDAL